MILYTRSEIAKVEYDDEKGFYLNDFIFDTLIQGNDTYLPLERSILLNDKLCITWTMAVGWIIAPTSNNQIDYLKYIPLSQYLSVNYGTKVSHHQDLSQKEQMINEYIETLQERIQIIQSFVSKQRPIHPDELLFILKEHKHPEITAIEELLLFLEKELNCWYVTKRILIEYGEFDCTNVVKLASNM